MLSTVAMTMSAAFGTFSEPPSVEGKVGSSQVKGTLTQALTKSQQVILHHSSDSTELAITLELLMMFEGKQNSPIDKLRILTAPNKV